MIGSGLVKGVGYRPGSYVEIPMLVWLDRS